MINFLPIAILAYALNGGAFVVNKIQLQTAQLTPISYTFYTGLLQIIAVVFIPFGFSFDIPFTAIISAILSGVIFILALYALFVSLKNTETSVAGPVIAALNPFFTFLIGALLLQEVLTNSQVTAFFVLMVGALIITANLWLTKIRLNKTLVLMTTSGFLFALSYIFLRQVFLETTFINGLVISRVSAAAFAFSFLLIPKIRSQISQRQQSQFQKNSVILFFLGQAMSGLSNLLIFWAVSLANPTLVNALFGVQYLVILSAALALSKNHPNLLDERLTKSTIIQKLFGAAILSYGVYLLSR